MLLVKKVRLYLKNDEVFVVHYNTTEHGLGLIGGKVIECSVDDPISLGEAVIESLDMSKVGIVDTGESLKILCKPLFDAIGVKSWRALERTCNSIVVRLIEENTCKIELEELSPDGGFSPRPDRAKRCELAAKKIGDTIHDIIESEK